MKTQLQFGNAATGQILVLRLAKGLQPPQKEYPLEIRGERDLNQLALVDTPVITTMELRVLPLALDLNSGNNLG
jgi:hypothetical protein